MTVETPTRRRPLAGAEAAFAELPAGLNVVELPFLTQLSLRVDPADPAAAAVAEVLGCELPGPNSATCSTLAQVLWLGPDEFLVLAQPGKQESVQQRLRAAIGTRFASVVDVSAQRTVLRLTGPLTREVLARGCAIDLDPRVSPAGTCVQTLLAQTGVVLLVRDHSPTRVCLLVRPSFAPYLAAWLVDACAEYGERRR